MASRTYEENRRLEELYGAAIPEGVGRPKSVGLKAGKDDPHWSEPVGYDPEDTSRVMTHRGRKVGLGGNRG